MLCDGPYTGPPSRDHANTGVVGPQDGTTPGWCLLPGGLLEGERVLFVTFRRRLAQGHFAVTAELSPPRSAELSGVEREVAVLKGYVDAVNVTDNQGANVRMSSIAVSLALIQGGLEPGTAQMSNACVSLGWKTSCAVSCGALKRVYGRIWPRDLSSLPSR